MFFTIKTQNVLLQKKKEGKKEGQKEHQQNWPQLFKRWIALSSG